MRIAALIALSWVMQPVSLQAAGCSDAWIQAVEKQLSVGDGQGHGPDLGSDEWRMVIERRLGPDPANLPDRSSDAWCDAVSQHLQRPTYDCAKARGSVETLICEDPELAGLDWQMKQVYQAASAKAANQHPPVLKSEQRGWVKGRNECWKADGKRDCVADAYRSRIVELQASYRLVSHNGPVAYYCDGNRANEVIATFFNTDPPTLIAERGDSTSLMVLQPAASGSQYQGRNESIWIKGDEALVVWGFEAPQMRCQKAE